eukprot:6194132-Pleurochrysis_carterae.AAC.2
MIDFAIGTEKYRLATYHPVQYLKLSPHNMLQFDTYMHSFPKCIRIACMHPLERLRSAPQVLDSHSAHSRPRLTERPRSEITHVGAPSPRACTRFLIL